ncbi:hypothetical protein ABW19_dt0204172 [Dactylella cylindrospora]|nr:hypothetical protein ABW19_dt0204172 [Dactylella cylindrospora]
MHSTDIDGVRTKSRGPICCTAGATRVPSRDSHNMHWRTVEYKHVMYLCYEEHPRPRYIQVSPIPNPRVDHGTKMSDSTAPVHFNRQFGLQLVAELQPCKGITEGP